MFIHLDDQTGQEIGVVGYDYDLEPLIRLMDNLVSDSRFSELFLTTNPDAFIVYSSADSSASRNFVLSDYLFPDDEDGKEAFEV